MLTKGMYVRCPADWEDSNDPRIFVCGQIIEIDEFTKNIRVSIHDPFDVLQFYENLPKGIVEFNSNQVERCKFFKDSKVEYNGDICEVISCKVNKETNYHDYHLLNNRTKKIIIASEKNIIASFNNGRVDPTSQLKKYEFQNPEWYLGRAITSRSIHILNNSFYGFDELAGSKIFLLPHQVNTIMRCLQENPMRYMLADEVGMGKTIEAISILKLYLNNKSNKKVLIIVPSTLVAQWKNELLIKFGISLGYDENNNLLEIITLDEINRRQMTQISDLIIIDEAHRYLSNQKEYDVIHTLSKNSVNLLLLSATPVQQERDEYLGLLRILFPNKYDKYSHEKFNELIHKQTAIVQKASTVLDTLEDYIEEIDSLKDEGEDAHDSEDLEEIFDEIFDDLEEICDLINDKKLKDILCKVEFESDDLGVAVMRILLSYICSNYQIESNVIRNRRKLLESDDVEHAMAYRELEQIPYELNSYVNPYEAAVYDDLKEIITDNINKLDIEEIKTLLTSFFSSPWAFDVALSKKYNINKSQIKLLKESTLYWKEQEKDNIRDINKICSFVKKTYSASRMTETLKFVKNNVKKEKVVLFTSFIDTYTVYKKALQNIYAESELSFFCENMSSDEIELNSYRFQNKPECRILLCDNTGGEGRNFQCADYIVHIDLPWDANMIEQRIGRLDRLERDPKRNVVTSVVPYVKDTFEDSLFKFWNEGLKIFEHSLSGMEIIMGKINNEINQAIMNDFEFGLAQKIPDILKMTEKMVETIRKEQSYDAASTLYKPLYTQLKILLDYYSRNENQLFTDAILSWGSLAGFNAHSVKKDVFEYSAYSFSPRSALKSLLIPPKWDSYLNNNQNSFVEKVLKTAGESTKNRSIRGTFVRKLALENDYIHFFAPGDEIYECITRNAIQNNKGQVAAFKVKSEINWMGIIFTWSVNLNEDILMDNGVSLDSIGQYRTYLPVEQMYIPVSISNQDKIDDDKIIFSYRKMLNKGVRGSSIEHLGRRGMKKSIAEAKIMSLSNLDWFKMQFPNEEWEKIIDNARETSKKKMLVQLKTKLKLVQARSEMDRVYSAKVANNMYFELDNNLAEFKRKQDLIFDSLKSPKVNLESAAFIWMGTD